MKCKLLLCVLTVALHQSGGSYYFSPFLPRNDVQQCPVGNPPKPLVLKLAEEMSILVQDMRTQVRINVEDLTKSLNDVNYRSVASALGYTVQILTAAGEYALEDGISSPTSSLSRGGAILESGGYNYEPLAFLRPSDTDCLGQFEPMVRKYRLDDRLLDLETQKRCFNITSTQLLPDKESFRLALMDFRREFQEDLSCALSSRTSAGRQKLLGYLKLYSRAASLRLSKL